MQCNAMHMHMHMQNARQESEKKRKLSRKQNKQLRKEGPHAAVSLLRSLGWGLVGGEGHGCLD